MLVSEGLELAVGPGIKNPILGTSQGSLSLVLGIVPCVLDLSEERILGGLGALLGLDALRLQIRGQLSRVPLLVRRDSVILPVILDEALKILAVRRSRVGDIVVREPSLELGLMPLVVGFGKTFMLALGYCGSGKVDAARVGFRHGEGRN